MADSCQDPVVLLRANAMAFVQVSGQIGAHRGHRNGHALEIFRRIQTCARLRAAWTVCRRRRGTALDVISVRVVHLIVDGVCRAGVGRGLPLTPLPPVALGTPTAAAQMG